jgi:hypothetical protein
MKYIETWQDAAKAAIDIDNTERLLELTFSIKALQEHSESFSESNYLQQVYEYSLIKSGVFGSFPSITELDFKLETGLARSGLNAVTAYLLAGEDLGMNLEEVREYYENSVKSLVEVTKDYRGDFEDILSTALIESFEKSLEANGSLEISELTEPSRAIVSYIRNANIFDTELDIEQAKEKVIDSMIYQLESGDFTLSQKLTNTRTFDDVIEQRCSASKIQNHYVDVIMEVLDNRDFWQAVYEQRLAEDLGSRYEIKSIGRVQDDFSLPNSMFVYDKVKQSSFVVETEDSNKLSEAFRAEIYAQPKLIHEQQQNSKKRKRNRLR